MTRKKWITLGIVVIASSLLMVTVVAASATHSSEAGAAALSANQRSVAEGPDGSLTIAAASPVSTSFTYQGQLKDGGSPVNGSCDMRFRLFDQATDGNQMGPDIFTTVPISDGLFTVSLDFGEVFTGTARWLEIGVQCPSDMGYTTLSPRQPLTAAPYALALPGLWTQQNETSPNLIGGYGGNTVAPGVVGATIGGGGSSGLINTVTGDYGTVGGGYGNTASGGDTVSGGTYNGASGGDATVGGGALNGASSSGATVGGGVLNDASGSNTTIGGGDTNTASGGSATIGGGDTNTASGDYAAIGGGRDNTAGDWADTVGGGENNAATGGSATVGGGYGNHANSNFATIGGGSDNVISGTASYATIGGGYDNDIGPNSNYSTIGGGTENTANMWYATVGGGYSNDATGNNATVAGGSGNIANGDYSFVAGGRSNVADNSYSFAAGRRARANHDGAFVWADSRNHNFNSTANNEFSVRATGGARFVLNINPDFGWPTWTCSVSSGDASWSCSSDRNLKENLVLADGNDVLERLSQMPVYYWNAKGQPTQHIGPMAQDFYAAYGVGGSDTAIATIDLDGVALAAIQGLYAENQELEQQNADLEARVAALEAALADGPAPAQVSHPNLLPWAGILLAGAGMAWVFRRRDGLILFNGGGR